jgi:hypothetical protein
MIITVVKKVKADGNLCRKSEEIWNKLKEAQLIQRFAGLKGTVTTVGEPVTQMFRIH